MDSRSGCNAPVQTAGQRSGKWPRPPSPVAVLPPSRAELGTWSGALRSAAQGGDRGAAPGAGQGRRQAQHSACTRARLSARGHPRPPATPAPADRNRSPLQPAPPASPVPNPASAHPTAQRRRCKPTRRMNLEASLKGSTKNPKLGNKIVIQSDKIKVQLGVSLTAVCPTSPVFDPASSSARRAGVNQG